MATYPLHEESDADLRAECVRRGINHGCAHGDSVSGWSCHCGAAGEGNSPHETQESLAAHMLEKGCRVPEYGPYGARLVALNLSTESLRAECERRGIPTSAPREAAMLATLRTERGEWQCRAETAEAECARRKTVVDAKNELLYGQGYEGGRGLKARVDLNSATRPDNSIAHLDEDLLCDDA